MTDETEYVANSSRSWGKGHSEIEAARRLIEYWHGKTPDTVEFSITEVAGFNGMERNGLSVGVDADEYYTTTRYEVEKDRFEELERVLTDATIEVEGILVDGKVEEIDHQEDDE